MSWPVFKIRAVVNSAVVSTLIEAAALLVFLAAIALWADFAAHAFPALHLV